MNDTNESVFVFCFLLNVGFTVYELSVLSEERISSAIQVQLLLQVQVQVLLQPVWLQHILNFLWFFMLDEKLTRESLD